MVRRPFVAQARGAHQPLSGSRTLCLCKVNQFCLFFFMAQRPGSAPAPQRRHQWPPVPEQCLVHEQYLYCGVGRPPMCMQFTRTPPHMDVGGALRVVGNWHNRIHETSWASGRWVRRGTRLTVQFRYKEPTTFYPMKILEWDPQQRVYACDTAYMLPMRPSKDFWDYMRRRHRPPQRPVPGLLLALPPPPPPCSTASCSCTCHSWGFCLFRGRPRR